MTLLEMLISLSLLAIIMTAVMAIYIVGVGAWRKGGVRAELLQDLQVASSRIVKDLERTSYASLSIGPTRDTISVLTMFDETGQFALDANGKPIWDRWVVYFRVGDELRRQEVAWGATPDVRATPVPIELLSPPQTLANYASGGRVIARDIYNFEVSVVPDTTSISVKLRLRRDVPRSGPQLVHLETVVGTRN